MKWTLLHPCGYSVSNVFAFFHNFRSRDGLLGPLSDVVIWKILYWFGDEELVIWTTTSACMNTNTASTILQWMVDPLSATAFIHIFFFEMYQNFLTIRKQIYYFLWTIFRKRVKIVGTKFSQRCICRWLGISACTALAWRDWHFRGQHTRITVTS